MDFVTDTARVAISLWSLLNTIIILIHLMSDKYHATAGWPFKGNKPDNQSVWPHKPVKPQSACLHFGCYDMGRRL